MSGASTEAESVRHIALDEVGSTNDEALRRARGGARGPFWITARTQTAGRGRRGRSWVSEPGNLYATLLLADPCEPARAAELSFVAALALHDALLAAVPAGLPSLLLKWPNDVLVGGRKCAGILVEGEQAFGGFVAALGIGVNCARHPTDAAFPATDLAAEGVALRPNDLFPPLADAIGRRLAQWRRGDGFAALRADWLDRTFRVGEQVRVRLPDRVVTGTFSGLDRDGRLMLQSTGGGPEIIAAGDVFAIGADVPAHEGRC
jgi:BirA family biotin operon repressor/biotin-[acetyl-CoA-carboxylase] ligase